MVSANPEPVCARSAEPCAGVRDTTEAFAFSRPALMQPNLTKFELQCDYECEMARPVVPSCAFA
jgi:hypothetical protein